MGVLLFLGAIVLVGVVVHFAFPAKAPLAPPRERSRSPTRSPLGEAIARGDGEAVRALLTGGVDPNDAVHDDLPALHEAVGCGTTALVPALLEAGANLDHVEPRIGSALALACARGDEATARSLVQAGIDLGLVMEGGAHALHVAALGGHLELVKLLVERGVPVDRPNFAGGTALRSAADAGHRTVVKYLLAEGADPDVADQFRKLPADYAAQRGHEAVARLLREAPRPRPPREHPRPVPHASFAQLLPRRADATINVARHCIANRLTGIRTASSSLEAPSCVLSLRSVMGDGFEVDAAHVDRPDPRQPIRPVRFAVWRYDGTRPRPATSAPPSARLARVRGLARTPFSERVWWERAAGETEDETSMRALVAAMAHPTDAPAYLDVWDWWLRFQVAAAFRIARAGTSAFVGSLRREVLLDLADGVADWTNTAAIVALGALARHDAGAREDVRTELLRIARRAVTPPAFQHAILPAAEALLDFDDLDAAVRAEMEELVCGPDEPHDAEDDAPADDDDE